MSAALSENPASVIHSLNLAHNSLDNQGNEKHHQIHLICWSCVLFNKINKPQNQNKFWGLFMLYFKILLHDNYSGLIIYLKMFFYHHK